MPDPAEEALAVVSLIGRSLGFDVLPLPRGGSGPPTLPVEVAANVVAEATSVSAPAKLEVLAQLTRKGFPRPVLEPIAVSLVRPDLDAGAHAAAVEELWNRVRGSRPGTDPLGRKMSDLVPPTVDDHSTQVEAPPSPQDLAGGPPQPRIEPATFVRMLVHDLQETSLSVVPRCDAKTRNVGGNPALSLATTAASSRDLSDLKSLVDPREWPRCPIQSVFFKSMNFVVPAAPPPPPLGVPDDNGWSATLQEVVDFSFGLDPEGSSRLMTDLDFVYFDTPSAAGATYDLNRSVDEEILVDRGYLLIENLASLGVRRTTTLKEVYFKNRAQPPLVCTLWSTAQALIGSSCIGHAHP